VNFAEGFLEISYRQAQTAELSDSMSRGEEIHEYLRFTGRQQRDTALHVLEGFILGIGMDRVVNPAEHREFREWIYSHEKLGNQDIAFRELLKTLKAALADGKLEPEEISDLHALCQRAKGDGFYDLVTHAIQELHGILHGVVADLIINEAELRELQGWLEEYENLKGLWPVTEIESVVVKVLADTRIDEGEHRMMLHYFAEFTPNRDIHRKLPALLPTELVIAGVCAADPAIQVSGKIFCFTGISSKGPRSLFATEVNQRGGGFTDSMREDVDYLIIGDEGNPCWAFSCYGRKVERAVQMRKTGHRLLLVHERDFWDAIR